MWRDSFRKNLERGEREREREREGEEVERKPGSPGRIFRSRSAFGHTRMDTVLRVSHRRHRGALSDSYWTIPTKTGGEGRRTVRLDVPFRVAISQPQLNTDGPLTDTAQWPSTGVTGTPNRTLTGRHQSRPKGEMRRVVRLGVPFRVAISQPQLNTDGPLTDTAQWSSTGVTGTPNRTLTGRHQPRP